MADTVRKLLRYLSLVPRRRWLDTLILFIGVLAPLFLFGELAEEVLEKEPFAIDRPILLFMQQHATPLLDRAMVFMSEAGSIRVLGPCALLLAVYFIIRQHWARLVYWVLAFGGAILLNMGAKQLFSRTRPDLWISIAPETSYSFPSGHSMQSMAFVTALVILAWHRPALRPWALAGALFVVLVGLSRVYLGVHFPTDVLAGWMASLAWCTGLSFVLRRRLKAERKLGRAAKAGGPR